MMNLLNEHFTALSVLFILTLLIVSEGIKKQAKLAHSESKSFKTSWYEMIFWVKIVVLLQSALVLFSILNYFKS